MSSTPAWDEAAPRYAVLLEEEPARDTVSHWLARWSDVRKLVWEGWSITKSAEGRDLTNEVARKSLRQFVETVLTPSEIADGQLAAKLLSLEVWEPEPEHAQFVRGLRYAAEIGGEQNVARVAELRALASRHEEMGARMTVALDGYELSGSEMDQMLQNPDRGVRERVWRARTRPWLEEQERIDALVLEMLRKRRVLAHDAGQLDYRAFAWRELMRLDYTPDDCLRLHADIETYLVPVAQTWYERRRTQLGVETLRPWDMRIDPLAAAPLQPFDTPNSFGDGMAAVLANRSPELGELFQRMRTANLVDLGWRKTKRPGGVERPFPLTGLPFISVCGDGSEINVGTLVHEMGHAYHDYLTMQHTQFEWQLRHTDEFSELAALGMWWLVEPFLTISRGGFYTAEEAVRNRVRLLEELTVRSLPSFAMKDAFQHWVHSEAPEEMTLRQLDEKWAELSSRFEPWIDWTGLEAEQGTVWRQDWSFFANPFYMVCYILANLGALQIRRADQIDSETTWQRYRAALSLGNTRPLPELYELAGASRPFALGIVQEVAKVVESELLPGISRKRA